MPIIEMKASVPVGKEIRKKLSDRFRKAFLKAGEPVCADNLAVRIEEDCWISFRGESESPAAIVTIHPGPLTPEEDYRPIVDDMFEAMRELLPEISPDRVYMTVSEIAHWGFSGRYL